MKFILVIFLLAVPSIAHAGATALSSARFVVEGGAGRVTSEALVVTNQSSEAQNYRFLAEDGSAVSASASISPQDFRLAPGASRTVVLRFRQPQESFTDTLKLIAYTPSDARSLVVGSGVNIPVQFIVPAPQVAGASVARAGPHVAWHMAVYISDALALGFAAWFIKFRPRQRLCARARHKISFV